MTSMNTDFTPDYGSLTPRQRDVLDRLTEGLSNQEIADQMCLTEYTIKYHCRALYQQFNVSNRYELMSALVRQHRTEMPAQFAG